MSNLSLEEMEREAYQRGDIERAKLLQCACDGSEDVREQLEQANDEADLAAYSLREAKTLVGLELDEILAAIEESDLGHAKVVIERLREKIEEL